MKSNMKNIAIVGLGLMGASLALTIRKRIEGVTIYGVSRSQRTVHIALKQGIIDIGSRNIRSLLSHTSLDLIIIATPIRSIIDVLAEIDNYAEEPVIVTDCGSTKMRLLNDIEKRKFVSVRFVGSHPMAGSHERGIDAARDNLYEDSFSFVIKTKKTDADAMRFVKAFWKILGVKTYTKSPKEHDEIVAKISHIPHCVASILLHSITTKNEDVLKYASSGLRDSVRIARSDSSLWADILVHNKINVMRGLERIEKSIQTYKMALVNDASTKIENLLEKSREKANKLG